LAILIGIIPESGPHIIFLSLYISGAIPLSILLVNSIVQDGLGALPLIAESKKTFFQVKFINMIVAAIVGFVGLQFGL
ncbi:MAG TPA: putative manganese transporter, partial [Bacteroidales bacterium]|nr:putative manganese transporter [Bacteroidales bacterium]